MVPLPPAPIVVTGGTGHIGRALVRGLSARGATVRAVSRRPHQAEPLPGVEWVRGDLTQADTLRRAFAGGGSLFLLSSPDENLVAAQTNALHVARLTGIHRIVKLSALGASDHSRSPVGRWHYEVEQALVSGGADWTILRPHYFMDNLLEQGPEVRDRSRILSPVGPGRVPFIDSRDIADVAASVLTSPGHSDRK